MNARDGHSLNSWAAGANRLTAGDVVVIIASPKAGSGVGRERIGGLAQRLSDEGLRVSTEVDMARAVDRLRGATEAGKKAVAVAAGGDGTLNLVASRLDRGVPIVPFPLGTENLVARYYGLLGPSGAFDLGRATETVIDGRARWIDAGIARFCHARFAEPRCRLFLVMASVGFDAEVVRRMHLTRKGHIRRWSYLKPIIAMLRRYRYPPVRVEPLVAHTRADGNAADPLTVAWALVFNLPRYAAGLAIETEADESDGLLDFCGLSRGSHLHGARYLAGVLAGRHRLWPDVLRQRSVGFRMTSDAPLAVQLDGDYVGRLPVEVTVDPARVLLRLPREVQ